MYSQNSGLSAEKPLDIFIDPEVFARCDLAALAHSTLTPLAMNSDPDFELTHFELIKAVKLITYQVNLVLKRQDYQFAEFQTRVADQTAELTKRMEGEVNRIQGHVLTIQNEAERHLDFFRRDFSDRLATLAKRQKTGPLLRGGEQPSEVPTWLKPLGTFLACLLESVKLHDSQPSIEARLLPRMRSLLHSKCDQALADIPHSVSAAKVQKDLSEYLNLERVKTKLASAINDP